MSDRIAFALDCRVIYRFCHSVPHLVKRYQWLESQTPESTLHGQITPLRGGFLAENDITRCPV